ncbi:VanW family protein [Ammoniphilus sp. YIM 78166]|uniref:VanW family protein n=1 Tax=Ammoniphilus sp. YIM 78166 TaxID=1644106 RepID=UPI001F0D4BD9|nr:VanW family protein [Ammoniphilus sp. YIM 78166]
MMPSIGYADNIKIQDLTGIGEDTGDKIVLYYLDQKFTYRISELILPGMGIPILNEKVVEKIGEHINEQIKVKEQSAYINGTGAIVEHLTGIALDRTKFFAVLQQLIYSKEESAASLPIQFIPPRVTTQQLKLSMQRQISSFATYYNNRNFNRSHNIQLASSAIHHYVLLPGETFSFNKVVGKRTAERGYKRAPVIVRGELSEGLGGGICQVSSTLFNAVDRAGLTILARYSHSKQVGYVPEGRDATVSWYGPDFSFRNDYDHPIMIKCYARHGANVVTIYSSKSLLAELRNVPEAPKTLPQETRQ